MCGRYNLIDSKEVRMLMQVLGIKLPVTSKVNIAPTELVTTISRQNSTNVAIPMRWWLVPHWAKEPSTKYAMFNARKETLKTSAAFKGSYARRRAIIPASSFIEWHQGPRQKTPYRLQKDNQALAFAGLWDRWENNGECIESCTIITRQAPESFPLHQRLPFILSEEQYEPWLDPNTDLTVIDDILENPENSVINAIPIKKAVGNAQNKAPQVIRATGEKSIFST